jgi:hypothetical protein
MPGQRPQWRSPHRRHLGISMALPRTIEVWLAVLGFVGLLAGLIVYEVVVWRECLVGEPWWYCLRILGG